MSETWLLSETPDAYVTIPGYKIFRRDHGRGGGVCIYVNSSLKINVINLPTPKQPGVEDLWVSVQYHMLPAIIIGCVYRHPKALAASFEYLQDVFSQICLCKKGFYHGIESKVFHARSFGHVTVTPVGPGWVRCRAPLIQSDRDLFPCHTPDLVRHPNTIFIPHIMPNSCAVRYCHNTKRKTKGYLSFYRFPKG